MIAPAKRGLGAWARRRAGTRSAPRLSVERDRERLRLGEGGSEGELGFCILIYSFSATGLIWASSELGILTEAFILMVTSSVN